MSLNRVQTFVLYRYRYAIAYTTLVVLSVVCLFFKLGTLVPGVSKNEASLGLSNLDLGDILAKGVYLPYNLLQWGLFQGLGANALSLRLASVMFAILALAMLFALLHMWHKDKIAVSIVVFLATSSWFLNYARYGGEEIYLAFSIIGVLFAGALIRHYSHKLLNVVLATILIALSLYSPFMIYILILFVIMYRQEFLEIARDINNRQIILGVFVFAIFFGPLIYGFVTDVENLKVWLGWDGSISGPLDYFNNVFGAISHVFWQSDALPELHLGRLAMLDIFTSTMIALGLYHYERHFNLLRTKFLIYGLGITFLILGLSARQQNYILVAPLLYILAATGIVTLLQQWNKIFPVNPFARTLGLVPMALAIVFTTQYHMNRYFYAWAGNPEVKQTYSIEPTLLKNDIRSTLGNGESSSVVVYVPFDQYEQTQFATFDQREKIELRNLDDYDSKTEISDGQTIYIHGQSRIRKPAGAVKFRIVATDSKSTPTAYYVYSK